MRRKNTAEDIWARILIPADPNACWEWQGGLSNKGYGWVKWRGRARLAHRISYELTYGAPPPDELDICHTCDNRKCCNPAHFFLCTDIENARDKALKGRAKQRKGEDSQNAILSNAQVEEIRRLWATGQYHRKDLALSFNVSAGHIKHLVKPRFLHEPGSVRSITNTRKYR